MIYNYNKNLVSTAQKLRKEMTPEEKHLWYDFLKKLPVTVNRQKNIGNYIVDFFIASHRIVIEIDGKQHRSEDGKEKDTVRDSELSALGITVLRYSNRSVDSHFTYVCNDILEHLGIDESELKKQ